MIKNKLRIFFLLLLMVCLLMSGCARTTTEIVDENGSNSVTLKFMGWEASPLETEAVKKGLETFMEQHPNIKVEYIPVPEDQYHSKLLTMLTGNAAPDVFFLGSSDYRIFQKRGVLLDLTSYFNEEYSLDEFIDSAAEIMEINDSIFGVSSCTVSPVIYYNKNLFDDAGLPYPPSDPESAWSWQEFIEVAKKLTIKEENNVVQYGVHGFEDIYMASALMLSNDGYPFNEDFTQSMFNKPEIKEVLQAIADLRLTEGVAPSASVLENMGMGPSQMLQTGKVAMIIDGSWALQELAKMGFPVGVAVLPKFKEALTHGQAHVHAAAANTKHPNEAWKLISFLSSEEYQIQLIKEGLWMPNRKALYTEDGVAKWYNNEVHPENFDQMIPYFSDAVAYPHVFVTDNVVGTIITEELDNFFHGGEAIDVVTEKIDKRVAEELSR